MFLTLQCLVETQMKTVLYLNIAIIIPIDMDHLSQNLRSE